RDRVEDECKAVRGGDALADAICELALVEVARHRPRPGRRDADDRSAEPRRVDAHRTEVRTRGSTLGAVEQPGACPSAKRVDRRFRHAADCTRRGRIERMRIATVQMSDGAKLAVDKDCDYRRLDLDGGLAALVRASIDPRDLAVGDAVAGELAAPLQPGKIVAIALNYLDHIRESNLPQPTQPLVF